MYILAGAVVAFVLAQSIFFLVRAYKQGKKIGISEKTMKNTIVSSSLFSIAPSISILATIITLSGALGLVLPWIRLTVIGAITYEVPAAESALNALGQIGGLSQEVTDPMQFSTIAWVMTLGSVMPLVLIPFMLKFIQKKVGGVASKNAAWANTMSAAAFIGLISAFIGRAVFGSGDYVPKNLEKLNIDFLSDTSEESKYMVKKAADALEDLVETAKEEKHNLA